MEIEGFPDVSATLRQIGRALIDAELHTSHPMMAKRIDLIGGLIEHTAGTVDLTDQLGKIVMSRKEIPIAVDEEFDRIVDGEFPLPDDDLPPDRLG